MSQEKDPVPAGRILAEVMGIYGRSMTELEGNLWKRIIANFGDEAVKRFLSKHLETSVFAPKPADAVAALRPGQGSAVAAFEELLRKVIAIGPYRSPKFDDPAIGGAVMLLGGWVAVNEQMPDPMNRRDYEAYFTRFEALYQQSKANLMMSNSEEPVRVLGLHSKQHQLAAASSTQLILKAPDEATVGRERVVTYPSRNGMTP